VKRFVLAALPAAAAFGALIPAIGPFFAFRLMVLLLALQSLGSGKPNLKGLRSVAAFRLLVGVWTVVGLAGSLLVQNQGLAMRAFLPLLLGFLLVYLLISSGDPRGVLRSLQTGWVIAFLLTGLLALREVLTGVHMSNYLPGYDLTVVDPRLVASVFGNPNNYAAFLVTTFAFLVNGLMEAKSWFMRRFYVGLVITLCLLMVTTGSRIGLIALVVELAICARYAGKRYRGATIGGVVLVLLAILFVGAGERDSLAMKMPEKLANATPSSVLDELLGGGRTTSGGQRVNLYRDGLWMVGDSAGFGVGPGQFEVVMASGDVPYDAGGTINPHNLYLEVASQYGIVVFLLFFGWVAACYRACRRGLRTSVGEEKSWGIAMVVAVAGNAVSALASSSYLPGSVNWVFMATLSLVAITLERRLQQEDRSGAHARVDAGRLGSSRALLSQVQSTGSER